MSDRQAERVGVTISDEERAAAFRAFWSELSREGDPELIVNKFPVAFRRGFDAGLERALDAFARGLDAFDREHPVEPQGRGEAAHTSAYANGGNLSEPQGRDREQVYDPLDDGCDDLRAEICRDYARAVEGRDGEDTRQWIIRSADAASVRAMCDDFERLLIVEDGDELEPAEVIDVVPKVTRDARDRLLDILAQERDKVEESVEMVRGELSDAQEDRQREHERAEAAERQVETLRSMLNDVRPPLAHHPLWVSFKSRAEAALASSEPKENTSE